MNVADADRRRARLSPGARWAAYLKGWRAYRRRNPCADCEREGRACDGCDLWLRVCERDIRTPHVAGDEE